MISGLGASSLRQGLVAALGLTAAMAAPALAAAPSPASDRLMIRQNISSAAAERAVAACKALSLKYGWTETIAVVDESGNLLSFLHMDGAGQHTIDFAQGKAHTALRLHGPSSNLVDMIGKGQLHALDWGLLPAEGGLPILVDGKLVGAIGASGSTAANDVACAQAGIDAALN